MTDIEKKIKNLEAQNKEFEKLIKNLQKKAFHLLWLWNLLPVFGPLIWFNLKYKKMSEEPYYSNAIGIKVEIAKNEVEIIKLKRKINPK